MTGKSEITPEMYAEAQESAESILYLLRGYRQRIEMGLEADSFRAGLARIISLMRRSLPGTHIMLGVSDEELQEIEDGADIPLLVVERLTNKMEGMKWALS